MITTLPAKTSRLLQPANISARSAPASGTAVASGAQAGRSESISSSNSTSSMASNYRLLGLRPREARVEVIRQAVQQAASHVQSAEAAPSAVGRDETTANVNSNVATASEHQLARIAIAGYRLLDPRRRRTLFERVQLLMWTEEELDANLTSMWASQPVTPKVKIAIKPSRRSEAASASSSADENQVALELFRSMRQRDRRALALWVGLAGLTISLAVTLSIFAYLA